MTMTAPKIPALLSAVALSASLLLVACKGAEPAADVPADPAAAPAEGDAPAEAAAPTAEGAAVVEESDAAAPADGLSGEDLLARALDPTSGLSGTVVTLARCSLLTTPGSDGTLPCRVLDQEGKDLKDATDLPMDIFFKQADLSPEAQAVVTACGDFCDVQISGKLEISPETFYLSMTEVSLKALD